MSDWAPGKQTGPVPSESLRPDSDKAEKGQAWDQTTILCAFLAGHMRSLQSLPPTGPR